jgi:hypothetical protein
VGGVGKRNKAFIIPEMGETISTAGDLASIALEGAAS